MALNNPLVPGDPYSYDLKWIVDKLKEAIALYEPLNQKFDDLYAFVNDYFDNLDITQEVQNIIDDMKDAGYFRNLVYEIAISDGNLQTIVTEWLDANVEPQGSAVAIDYSLTISGAAADAAVTGERTRAALSVVNASGSLGQYDALVDQYISSGTPTTLAGYNTYLIPVEEGDIITLQDSTEGTYFFGPSLSQGAILGTVAGNVYTGLSAGGYAMHRIDAPNNCYTIIVPTGADHVYVSANRQYAANVKVEKNHPSPSASDVLVNPWDVVCDVEEAGAYSMGYRSANSSQFQFIGAGYHARVMKMKAGDTFLFLDGNATGFGIHYAATLINNVTANVDVPAYTATQDGIIQVYYKDDEPKRNVYYPAGGIKINYDHVIGMGGDYSGKEGVAFGTSLTARANGGEGYLNRLATLSGVTFDNQGVGSATLAATILPRIRSYTNYASKDVVLLEGFVNDWYQDLTLGVYTDSTTATVCGALRTALNYIQAQNQNATVFLILDHYGRLYNSTDESSTQVNGSGLTQFQYYEELAKVAESMGVKVIKLYATSGMNEYTPQYFADDIHVNAAGAYRSGNVIWDVMKNYTPK